METKKFRGYHWLVLIVIVASLLDSTIAASFAQWIMQPQFMGVPQLVLQSLLLMVLIGPALSFDLPLAAVAGLLVDMWTTGLIGVHLLVWPLTLYLLKQVKPYVPNSPLFHWLVMLMTLFIAMLGEMVINQLFGYVPLSASDWVAERVAPGFIVNTIIFMISYLPLRRILLNLGKK